MKKVFVGVLLFFLAFSSTAFAGTFDSVVNYIKSQETQTGIYYSFDDKETHGYIGRTLIKDVYIDRLDLSLAWDLKDAIGLEASYTIKEGTLAPYAGVILGTNRIEALEAHELGEAFIAVSGGVKF